MRYALLLLLPLLAACGDHHHDHAPAAEAHGHEHGHSGPVVTLKVEGDAARLWGHINAITAKLTSPIPEATRATLASDAVNVAALAAALEPFATKSPDADRAAGMLANLARAAEQLAHQADENMSIDESLVRFTEVLRLARRLNPASMSPAVEPTYVAGPSGGVLAEIRDASGKSVGWAEIKLHGDAGDLELWLAHDQRITSPLRMPVSTVAKLELLGPGRTIELRVRDVQANKDEQGRATVFDGQTHYLVFPGETGVDASWLMGEDFRSTARLTIEGLTAEFELKPH